MGRNCVDNPYLSTFSAQLQTLDATVGDGVIVGEWTMAGISTVIATASGHQIAKRRLEDFADLTGAKVLQTGPTQWLIISQYGREKWATKLATAIDNSASQFDQSAGYGLITLSGSNSQRVLQKGLFVDLEVALAADGSSFSSVIAHVPVIVGRTGPDTFIIAVPRSYGSSFWHWLESAAAAESIKLARQG